MLKMKITQTQKTKAINLIKRTETVLKSLYESSNSNTNDIIMLESDLTDLHSILKGEY